MKNLICFVLLIVTATINAQDVAGVYQLNTVSNDFELKRTLTLNIDGTFEYYNFRRVEKGIPPETHIYGKGVWIIENKVINFTSEASDIDDKFTLDFTGTKARFISKSPRDKSDRVIETSIKFFESEVPWIKGMLLIKQ